jgi:hypothetical protein
MWCFFGSMAVSVGFGVKMIIQSLGSNIPSGASFLGVESRVGRVIVAGALAIFTVAVVACVWLMLRPGWYINTGNLHDVFLPLNSALAAHQGLGLHKDFHTPFGWVYACLNKWAWLYINEGGGLSINDITVVASIFWVALILFAFVVCLLALPRTHRPNWLQTWLLGLLLVLLSFNFRGVSTFSIKDITWYGAYNGHLWSLMSLQMILVFIAARTQPTRRVVIVSAIMQALCVTMSVNYKISFGLASLLLALAPLFVRANGFAWRGGYLLLTLFLCISASIVLSPVDYSYGLYLRDIRSALVAKSEFSSDGGHIFAAFMMLVLCTALVALLQLRMVGKGEASVVVNCGRRFRVLDITFGGLISAGVVLGVLGDFSKPFYMVLVCVAVCVLIFAAGGVWGVALRRFAVAYLCVILVFGLWSNFRIVGYKGGAAKNNYEKVVVSTKYGDLKWVIPGGATYNGLTEIFELKENPKKLDVLLNIAFPFDEEYRKYRVPFHNGDYVKSMNLARETVADLMMQGHNNVLMLAFANPLPLLVGGRLPKGSEHWIHFGTATPMFEKDNEMFATFQSSDIIVLPVTSIDSRSQIFLNCKFFVWNMSRAEPHQLVHYDKYNFYFTKSPSAAAIPIDQVEIRSRCEEIVNKFRSGKA